QRIAEVEGARNRLDDAAVYSIKDALTRIENSDESNVVPLIVQAFGFGATLGEITKAIRGPVDPVENIRPLPNKRLAANYEALRAASAKYAAENGQAPLIFLCNLGPLRRHKARADFTKGFFESGGFQVISPNGFESPEAAAAALAESSAGIAVVCGTDDD